jgi:hypothetical protein
LQNNLLKKMIRQKIRCLIYDFHEKRGRMSEIISIFAAVLKKETER